MPTKEIQKIERSKLKTIRMAELCKLTGYKMATVYRLMRIGLLHPALQNGLKPVYDESHVKRLKRIKYLREEEKLSYSEIEKIFNVRNGYREKDESTVSIKDQIVNKGSELFCQKGFQNTKITDITDALNISKGSFYLHFKDKRELLVECLDRVLYYIIPKEKWELIGKEKDPIERLIKRVEIYFSVFPDFMGYIELLKSAFKSNDLDLSKKSQAAAVKIIAPVVKDIKWGVDNGIFNDIDPEFFGYIFIGISEILGYRLMMDSKYSPADIISFIKYLITEILVIKKDSQVANQENQVCTCIVTDRNGIETMANNVLFNDKCYLFGKIGEAFVSMKLADIYNLSVCEGSDFKVDVQMKNGDCATVAIEDEIDITGVCSFGEYRVSLDKLSQIKFVNNE